MMYSYNVQYNTQLQCIYAMHSYSAQLQCTATINSYNTQLQCTATMHSYNAQLQCSATIHSYNAQLQYTATMHSYNVQLQLTGSCSSVINARLRDILFICVCVFPFDAVLMCREWQEFPGLGTWLHQLPEWRSINPLPPLPPNHMKCAWLRPLYLGYGDTSPSILPLQFLADASVLFEVWPGQCVWLFDLYLGGTRCWLQFLSQTECQTSWSVEPTLACGCHLTSETLNGFAWLCM